MQVIGIGAQYDFEQAQRFLNTSGMQHTPMLWEQSGNFWRLENVSHNSAMQLYSFDLTKKSGVIFFNERGRETVVDAASAPPWKPS